MTIYEFIPKVSTGEHHFQCAICDMTIYRSIAIDHFPICAMCRWFCSVEGRWGRKFDGITLSTPEDSR